MYNLIPDLKKSLLDGSKESIEDLSEVFIDSLLKDGILKDIPIVNTLSGIINTFHNIKDRNLLKQTLQFIKEFNEGTIISEKLMRYKHEIENDKNKLEEEFSRVLWILNETIENKKTILLANLFRNYINEKITWDEFCDFSDTIRNFYLTDLQLLSEIYFGNVVETQNYPVHSINRLKSLGLIDTRDKGGLTFETVSKYYPYNQNVGLTKIGGKFYESIIKK